MLLILFFQTYVVMPSSLAVKKRLSTDGVSIIDMNDDGYDFETKASGFLIDHYFYGKPVAMSDISKLFRETSNWYLRNDTFLNQIRDLKPDLLVPSIILKVCDFFFNQPSIVVYFWFSFRRDMVTWNLKLFVVRW